MTARDRLRRDLAAFGQDHLLALDHRLDAADLDRFHAELADVDWEQLATLVHEAAMPSPAAGTLEPAPVTVKGASAERDAAARRIGEELLRAGRVALFTVAGGQGSRLGFPGPKGLFPATPVRAKTLFMLFAERIAAIGRALGATPPWYVMTSAANDAETRLAFADAGWFGLDPDRVRFVVQDMLPAVDAEGRALLAAPGRLFLSPNGHGGSLLALRRSGALDEMREAGIEEIFYFQVDNPLVEIADPVFLGHHRLAEAEMSTKVVRKRDAAEKVGVVGLIDGRFGVIEYSDLRPELREQRGDDGELRFNAGNIAVHAIRRDFAEALTANGLDLPYHVARKSIACVDPHTGESREVEGMKFETFVFDALARCRRSLVLEVRRELEFAPIKNADGEDSPATSRRAQIELHAGWLATAGHPEARDADGECARAIEIAPSYALSAEELAARADLGDRLRAVADRDEVYLA